MVQRIGLTGRVFRMLKENNLMIEELQHSITNQNRRYEEWMLRKNLDVPIEWSNDIVNISDQPYAPGYPILGPIEEIKEEVDDLVGAPLDKPNFTDEVVGVVKWVDGTILDSIFKVNR